MIHKIRALSIAAVAAFALAPGFASAAAAPNCAAANTSGSLNVVGLTSDSRLICFNEFAPANAVTIGFTYGLTGGDYRLVGIDFRVQDGGLYGVGNAGGVYRLSLTDGTATFVNRLSVALSGNNFGVDFNPAADRLRIISDNGQNLRHNINAGGVTLTDGALNYVAGTAANGVTGAAYTNNDLVALTATTLFDLDAELDQIALQSPPNSGTLVTTGKLGVNASYVAGFDIYSQLASGGTVGNFALAAFRGPSSSSQTAVYSVNVLTGAATLRGSLSTDNDVYDIAIPLNQF